MIKLKRFTVTVDNVSAVAFELFLATWAGFYGVSSAKFFIMHK